MYDASLPALRILADHRERASGVPDLIATQGHVEVAFGTLSVGDYLVGGRVVFERKTIDDFAASIVDTRLFRQASRLLRSPHRPALLLEGRYRAARCAVPREAMQGALISVSLVFDVPVLRAVDKHESARLIVYAAKQLADLEPRATLRSHRQPKRPSTRRLHILQSLPGVGRDRAARLLEHFGSVERCISATMEELTEVPGIGSKTARAIRTVVAGPVH